MAKISIDKNRMSADMASAVVAGVTALIKKYNLPVKESMAIWVEAWGGELEKAVDGADLGVKDAVTNIKNYNETKSN